MSRQRIRGECVRISLMTRVSWALVEMVIDCPGELRAEGVAGVIGDPSLVFVARGEHAEGDRASRPLEDARGRSRVCQASGLEGDLDLRRQQAGELVAVFAGRRCVSISSLAFGLTTSLR